MFDIPAPPKKTTLSAKIREDIVEELDLLTEFVQEQKGDHISRSHVLEYILDDGYFGSQKREVKEYFQWKAKKREEKEDSQESGEEEKAKKEVASQAEGDEQPKKREGVETEKSQKTKTKAKTTDRQTGATTKAAGERVKRKIKR